MEVAQALHDSVEHLFRAADEDVSFTDVGDQASQDTSAQRFEGDLATTPSDDVVDGVAAIAHQLIDLLPEHDVFPRTRAVDERDGVLALRHLLEERTHRRDADAPGDERDP